MKIIWPSKMSKIAYAAFERFVQVESLCDNIVKADEGIGRYAHAWISLDGNTPEDMFNMMASLATWPAYVNTDIKSVEAYVFPNRNTYYVFFSNGRSDSESQLVEFINTAACKAMREALNTANNDMVRALKGV